MYERKEHQGLQAFVRKVNGMILLDQRSLYCRVFVFAHRRFFAIFGSKFCRSEMGYSGSWSRSMVMQSREAAAIC